MREEIKKAVLEILQKNPEELKHAENTLKWLLKIRPDSDFVLVVSALGHDIERTAAKNKEGKVSYIDYKKLHSIKSFEILKEILQKYKTDEKDIQRIQNIVLNHEFGGDSDSNLVKDADSLSNFQWCDDMFGKLETNQLKETMKRMYKRMEKENKKFAESIDFKNKEVKNWLEEFY